MPIGQADQQEHQVGVDLATVSGSSPVRGASTSPAWGPEPVTTVPTYSTVQATTNVARASQATGSGHRRPRWLVLLVDPSQKDDRDRDHRQRQQEVQRDDPRVEVGQHA